MSARAKSFEQLAALVEFLRGPEGCPWDRRQTHHSLVPYLLEETYEVVGAIDDWEREPHRLREELGDLLLQVMLHSVIASERGAFTLKDVLDGLREKLIRRHPHVFGDKQAGDAGEVMQIWEQVKAVEKEEAEGGNSAGDHNGSLLDSVSEGLPPAARAYALQQQAATVGFDWPDAQAAMAKVHEELKELQEALQSGCATAIAEEIGDALFALINVARLAGYHPDQAIANANTKFIRRFQQMERLAEQQGFRLDDMTLEQMDRLWDKTKQPIL